MEIMFFFFALSLALEIQRNPHMSTIIRLTFQILRFVTKRIQKLKLSFHYALTFINLTIKQVFDSSFNIP